MGLAHLLEQAKGTIVNAWLDMVIKTYAPDASQFLKGQKDAFANPVGNTLARGLDSLYDQLHVATDRRTLEQILDPVIRIRAVQTFSPSQALGSIFNLKQ